GSPQLNPPGQYRDLLIAQLTLRGHVQIALMPYRFDEQTLRRLSRHDCRALVASAQECCPRVHPQGRLLLGRTVTFLASLHQKRPHLVLKKRRWRFFSVHGQDQNQHEQGNLDNSRGHVVLQFPSSRCTTLTRACGGAPGGGKAYRWPASDRRRGVRRESHNAA